MNTIWKMTKGKRGFFIASIICLIASTTLWGTFPLVIKAALDSITSGEKNILAYAGILILITIAQALFMFLKGRWLAKATESTIRDIKNRLYDHLQRLKCSEQAKASTGDWVQRCTSDVETVRNFMTAGAMEIIRVLFLSIVVTFIMFAINPKLASVSLVLVPVVFAVAVVFYRKLQTLFKCQAETEALATVILQENFTAIRVVKAFARQQYETEKFDKQNTKWSELFIKINRLIALYWMVSVQLTFWQITATVVYACSLPLSDAITVGTITAFVSYQVMLLVPIQHIGQPINDMGKAIVSAKRIKELFDKPQEDFGIVDKKPKIKGDIEFSNISFSYDDALSSLSDISFKLKKGQTLGLVGATGEGKTTIINLLCRLYDYEEGEIQVDGVPIKDIDRTWLRHHVGVVSQEAFLFSKTIKENIAIAKANILEHEILNAAEVACVHDTIMGFGDGYETLLGERGVNLSGGQKQRIAIARTVMRNYPILVFDDCLSAVDGKTEVTIREALKKRSNNTTTIIISHKIETIKDADLILVLEKGRIVQRGIHNDLVNLPGIYKEMWDIQQNGGDVYESA